MTSLTTAARELHELRAALAEHQKQAQAEERRLRAQIKERADVLQKTEAGLDAEKIALAKTIIAVRGAFDKAGTDRESCRADAIKQLATGDPVRPVYGDLWSRYFGTKSYNRWYGQRSDHEYGYGPRHGSIIFSIGLTNDARQRKQDDLSLAEIESAIYYLLNLERVQTAEAKAAADAAA